MTFNEPYNSCEAGYGLGVAAPGILGENEFYGRHSIRN
jgi:hypothetical protein